MVLVSAFVVNGTPEASPSVDFPVKSDTGESARGYLGRRALAMTQTPEESLPTAGEAVDFPARATFPWARGVVLRTTVEACRKMNGCDQGSEGRHGRQVLAGGGAQFVKTMADRWAVDQWYIWVWF